MAGPGKKTLDRALSRAGVCSRTQARALVDAGRVTVNGRAARDPEAWIDLVRDRVLVDGQPLQAVRKQVWMLHKPVGYVTTADDERGRQTVYDLLPADVPWLAPVGRLDKDTSGLLLFTNDSDLAHAITEPSTELPKRYVVTCRPPLDDAALRALAAGVTLDDGPTRRARVAPRPGPADASTFALEITEGRNRQVRRMVEAVGSEVLALHRERIGPLELGELPIGSLRRLSADEVAALRAAVGPARVTARRGPPRPRTNPGSAR